MANAAYPPGAFFKHTTVTPAVITKRAKAKAEADEWRRCCQRVDERDKRRCYVTGATLSAGAVDPWAALERHHIEPRSLSKSRRFNANNIVTVCRAVHQLIHGGLLRLWAKDGKPARSFDAIDHVSWDRLRLPKGSEPCRIRRGLAVRDAR